MEQLYQALIALGIVIIGGLATLIKVLIDRIAKDLAENTTITIQAKDASNGRLSEVMDRLAASRDQVQGLRWIVRERDDRLAYIVARLPEAASLMRDYKDQRTARITASEEEAAERHILNTEK